MLNMSYSVRRDTTFVLLAKHFKSPLIGHSMCASMSIHTHILFFFPQGKTSFWKIWLRDLL